MIIEVLFELGESTLPAHGGIEGPVWAAWNFDPTVLIPAALVAFWYGRGWRRTRKRTRPHWTRVALFYSGLAVIVLAIESPLDRLGEHHFTFHMLQHELFLLAGTPLVLLGVPVRPMLLGLPSRVRHDIVRPVARSSVARRVYRALTWPVTSTGLLAIVLFAGT